MCSLDIDTFLLLIVAQNSTIEHNVEWVRGSEKFQKFADIRAFGGTGFLFWGCLGSQANTEFGPIMSNF